MARLVSVGFELNDQPVSAAVGMEASHHTSSADVSPLSVQSTTKRSGTYALRCGGSGQPLVTGTQSYVDYRLATTATTGPYFPRVYVLFKSFPSVETRFIDLRGGGSGAHVTINGVGSVEFYDFTGSIGNGGVFAVDTWYRVEIEYDASQGAGSDIVNLYIDGSLAIGSTTRNLTQTVQDIRLGGNLGAEANAAGEWYFDDVAGNDSSGSAQTGLPGAGSIVHIWPDGDGDADTLVTRSGAGTTPTGTDRGANWQQLGAAFDKPTPNDATDFLLLTANTSEVLVACESSATAGIGASDSITLVHVGGRITGVTTSSGNWIARVMSQSAGTKLSSATVTLASATWHTNDDTSGTRQYKITSYTDPQAGGAWTPALIDTMQIGAATTDGNPDTLVTALWALVEYVPEVVGTGQPTMKRWGGVPFVRHKVNGGSPGGAW